MLAQILTSIRAIDKDNVKKSGGLAAAITVSLSVATLIGAPIPGWAAVVGPIVGTVVYKLLPKKVEDEIDAVADKVIDVATDIPQVYSAPSDYPNAAREGTAGDKA